MFDPRQPDYTNTPVAASRPPAAYAPAGPAPPVVTVVTPFYNAGEIFDETARSVLGQSLQQFEWVIVNDASSSADALTRLARYRDADPRIRVIDHPVNRGLAAARNTGIAAARAPFAFLLDDDDLIEPTCLEKLYWTLQSYPEYAFASAEVIGFGAQQYHWRHGFHRGADFLAENLTTAMAMIRTSVHAAVGGFDEDIRGGLEDWDYWLRCAAAGHWGVTLAEPLLWYRRRERTGDRWSNMDGQAWRERFQRGLRDKYPQLYAGRFPRIEPPQSPPLAPVRRELPCENRLAPARRHLLMILPWLTLGGADRFNLDLVTQLRGRGWEITIATTLPHENPWLPDFARCTSDIFALWNFLRPIDHPIFLRYLIESRRPQIVMISNSELGYTLLPYLRALCPEPVYVDYAHMEEEYWRSGGHPRYAAGMQDLLERNFVASEHLRQWMASRGADADRIRVVYINVDPQLWKPDPDRRRAVRREHGLGDDTPLILYACRLAPQKQPRVFARVMRTLADRGLDFAALVAGDGPDRPWLEAELRAAGLDQRVRLVGSKTAAQMQALMPACDILFLPSLWEGIALSIYEAMSCGLAVVGARVGGQAELVTPACGVLLERGSEAEQVAGYAEALARLIADPSERRAMGTRARERICESFTLDQMGERMVGELEELIATPALRRCVHLPPGFAHECATQAVEAQRTQRGLEEVWARMTAAEAEAAKLRSGVTGLAWTAARKVARRLGLAH